MNATDLLKINWGRFIVSENITKQPGFMAFFFENFRPVRYELDIWTGRYYILCESVLFDAIEEGRPIPEYSITIQTDEQTGALILKDLEKVR